MMVCVYRDHRRHGDCEDEEASEHDKAGGKRSACSDGSALPAA